VIGNELIEAAMSQRARFFEEYCYRDLIQEYYKRDPKMIWTVAPKPQMKDNLYRDCVDRQLGREAYWSLPMEKRFERMHMYEFSTTEAEPVWDAADCTRLGKDVFVQHSKTTNRFGFEWLRRHLAARGLEAHMLHFPYDIFPSHIDCTFVPLRPGLVLTNYERPVCEEEVVKFREGKWKFIDAPKPCELNFPMPDWCQSSHWLSMNILSLGPNKIVIEEEEKDLYRLLHDELGFDVITTPFRNCYEFGGSLHCATCDIRRDDSLKDFFAEEYN
jgi:glycine amidinotransferase